MGLYGLAAIPDRCDGDWRYHSLWHDALLSPDKRRFFLFPCLSFFPPGSTLRKTLEGKSYAHILPVVAAVRPHAFLVVAWQVSATPLKALPW